jgi:rhodanese-related sulfurtransferase
MTFLKSLFRSGASTSNQIEVLDKETYKKEIAKEAVQLVDVRTPKEYKGGHLAKAVNIDFFHHGSFRTAFAKFDKEKPVYLYCRSGQRSLKAAKKLISWGFTKIYDLEGGILNWQKTEK